MTTRLSAPDLQALVEGGQAFCMAPWVNLSVATGGAAAPCCEIKGRFGDARSQALTDIWRAPSFERLRDSLLLDKKTPRCWKCYDVEVAGGLSMRQSYNRDYGSRAAEIVTGNRQPIRLDIRFSNLCNFTCRMCWHKASSRWHSDGLKIGQRLGPTALIRSFKTFEDAIAEVAPLLETVETIYWAGGEPLLQEEHYEVLKRLLDLGRGDVALSYNTNLSEFELGDVGVFPIWADFPNLDLEISIDGIGARAELIRNGLVWTRFLENLERLRAEAPHARIRFGVTVSVLNVAALAEIHECLMALSGCAADDFRLHVLQQWEGYCVNVLPRAMKEKISEELGRYAQRLPATGGLHMARAQFLHVVGFMNKEDRSDMLPAFRKTTLDLDRIRGQDTAVACPELATLLA